MCSMPCNGGHYLAWLYLITVASLIVDGNTAYSDLTSTDAAPLVELSQVSDDYSLRNIGETRSMLADADTPLQIPESAASVHPGGILPFPEGAKDVPRQEGLLKEETSPQRSYEDSDRPMVITEAYLVRHLPEEHLKPPGKLFWVQRLLMLGLFVSWILIGQRAAAEGASDGLSRAFLVVWTISLLMSLFKKTPDHSYLIVARTGADGQSQASGTGSAKRSKLSKFLANALSVIITLLIVVLFGPLIFFVTGILLAAMLAAVLGIAMCLSR